MDIGRGKVNMSAAGEAAIMQAAQKNVASVVSDVVRLQSGGM
jgi:hypothetical protein